MHITLIEPAGEDDSLGLLAERLKSHGFLPSIDTTPSGVPSRVSREGSRAILVNLGSTPGSPASMVRDIRRSGLDQPCLVLSGLVDWRVRIDCLDAGADDFVVKPVRSEEIAARLRALIRRSAGNASDLIESGDLKLDLRTRCAWLDGEYLKLTRNEFRLLRLFLLEQGNVMTHEEIHYQLYSKGQCFNPNVIEVQIARLRRKIGKDRIRTIRGLGYSYAEVSESETTTNRHLEDCRAPCSASWEAEDHSSAPKACTC